MQKAILETFNILKSLQDRMTKEGKIGQGEGFSQQELIIFNVADWAAEEVAQLCHHYDHALHGAGELIDAFVSIGKFHYLPDTQIRSCFLSSRLIFENMVINRIVLTQVLAFYDK